MSRVAAVACAGALVLAGCGSGTDLPTDVDAVVASSSAAPDQARHRYRGVVADEPRPRPDFVLRDTDGEAFGLRERTAGRALFLFFGFTHCPDECPTAMADLAVALRDVPAAVRERVEVVFVTTDPQRDTPAVLRRWLDRFDPSFVGLTGTPQELAAAQTAAGVPVATTSAPEPDHTDAPGSAPHSHGHSEAGGYSVDHSAALTAYARDDSVTVLYPAGSVPDDLTADLPALAQEEAPS